jgi:peptidoglycan/xylan/chitin deacetylase (PgdA/CDA1 family)
MVDVLVLCYHAVSERWPAALSVTPERLREQLEWLSGHGYRFVTLTEAMEVQSGRVAALTFDDAFRSVLELGVPELERVDARGTLFVPTDFPGGDGPLAWPGIDHWLGTEHEPELASMSWDEVRGLADAGWEIGSHTRSHPRLTTLGEKALEEELRGSRDRLEQELGFACRSLAYPYGDFDARVARAAAAAAYSRAVTLPAGVHRPQALAWPRVGVWHEDGPRAFRLKASPLLRRFRASQLWAAVDVPRRALGLRIDRAGPLPGRRRPGPPGARA